MKFRCLILFLTLIFGSNVFSALPPYITKDTFSTICSKNYCSRDLNSQYVSTYFHKQFHKALALSYSKSGNKYSIDYVFWSYQYPNKIEAESAAINGCKKSARNCEIFLVNNSYANESLLNKLNNKTNYSSSKIPSNAYKSGNGWKCKSGYYRNKSYCAKLPTGGIAYGSGDGFYCKSGFKKSGFQCFKTVNIPSNAYSTGNSQGWKCNSLYYQSNNSCLRLPSNASAYGSGDGYYCKTGYRKSSSQNKCIKKVNIPPNAYASSSNPNGWECKYQFYKFNNSCLKLPSNAIQKSIGDGFYCKTGYEKYGSGCRAKISQEDAYELAEIAYDSGEYQKAFREFSVLANEGNEEAQNFIAYMYENGEGVSKSQKLALYWYRKAALQGFSVAQCNLGYLYEKGQGTAKDFSQAVNWYRKAANQGLSRCQNNLGLMYDLGNGVVKDHQEAFRWYLKAANQGNKYAQYNLGLLYEYGNGVSQNFKLALTWYQKASDQGLTGAKEKVKAMQSKIKSNEDKAKINIPNNAYASNSDPQGWKCKSLYYENNNACYRLPSNAVAKSYGDGFYCKTGYKKSGDYCTKENSEIYIDGDKYVGPLKNGKPHGKGTLTTPDGDVYVGEFKNGEPYGKGTLTTKDGDIYSGDFTSGELEGEGTFTFADGYSITGNFSNGVPDGMFTASNPDGTKIIVEFIDGEPSTKNVTVIYLDGKKYLGGWKDGSREGYGKMTYPDGTIQEGFWKDDEFQFANKDSNPNNNNQNNLDVLPASSGSGFAVTSDGYVVTNHHVIDGCNNVEIINRGKAISATVVSFDSNNDLALLKSNFKPLHTFPLRRDNPYNLMDVYVAGYPFGYDISTPIKITEGIVSSLAGLGNNFSQIQIDAAVQPGNSGGPIIDSKGNVVGVVVSKLDLEKMMENYGVVPEGTNFGIKSNVVINFLESNNIELIEVNNKALPKKNLGQNISNGTYYISCLMTMAQINKMKEKKAFFSNIQ